MKNIYKLTGANYSAKVMVEEMMKVYQTLK